MGIITNIKENLMHLIQEINVVIVAFVKFLTYNNGIKAIYNASNVNSWVASTHVSLVMSLTYAPYL